MRKALVDLVEDCGGGCVAAPNQTVEESMMKRIVMALLAVTMVFGSVMMTGCGSAEEPAAPETEEAAPEAGGEES